MRPELLELCAIVPSEYDRNVTKTVIYKNIFIYPLGNLMIIWVKPLMGLSWSMVGDVGV